MKILIFKRINQLIITLKNTIPGFLLISTYLNFHYVVLLLYKFEMNII